MTSVTICALGRVRDKRNNLNLRQVAKLHIVPFHEQMSGSKLGMGHMSL